MTATITENRVCYDCYEPTVPGMSRCQRHREQVARLKRERTARERPIKDLVRTAALVARLQECGVWVGETPDFQLMRQRMERLAAGATHGEV